MIRVLIADDDPVLPETLEQMINAEPGMELVGVAEDAAGAVELAAETHPEVAVLDWVMPGGGGPAAARRLLDDHSNIRVIALTAHDSLEASVDMLRAGATNVVVKGSPDVLGAIRAAAEESG